MQSWPHVRSFEMVFPGTHLPEIAWGFIMYPVIWDKDVIQVLLHPSGVHAKLWVMKGYTLTLDRYYHLNDVNITIGFTLDLATVFKKPESALAYLHSKYSWYTMLNSKIMPRADPHLFGFVLCFNAGLQRTLRESIHKHVDGPREEPLDGPVEEDHPTPTGANFMNHVHNSVEEFVHDDSGQVMMQWDGPREENDPTSRHLNAPAQDGRFWLAVVGQNSLVISCQSERHDVNINVKEEMCQPNPKPTYNPANIDDIQLEDY